MRNIFSALVIATSFALLVPDNRAQAVRAAELVAVPVAVTQSIPAASGIPGTEGRGDAQAPSEMSWLLALGFLAVVVARRLRPD